MRQVRCKHAIWSWCVEESVLRIVLKQTKCTITLTIIGESMQHQETWAARRGKSKRRTWGSYESYRFILEVRLISLYFIRQSKFIVYPKYRLQVWASPMYKSVPQYVPQRFDLLSFRLISCICNCLRFETLIHLRLLLKICRVWLLTSNSVNSK